MLSYCLKCKRNTESIDPKVFATSNGRTMILSGCAICAIICYNVLQYVLKQEAKGLLSNLGIRTPLSIPLLGDILF